MSLYGSRPYGGLSSLGSYGSSSYARPANFGIGSYASRPMSYGAPKASYAAPQMSYAAQQPIKGQSRIEYFPVQRKEIEYEQVQKSYSEQVPVQKIEYQTVQKSYTESIPREKIVTDYQAVEYQKEYIPRTVYDTVQEQVPVQSTEYVPVQKTEYVPQQRTDYVTQSRQVSRVEYDEVEYQVQKPTIQAAQVSYAQPAAYASYAQPAQLASSQIIAAPALSSSYGGARLY